jgi:hypothetical protein
MYVEELFTFLAYLSLFYSTQVGGLEFASSFSAAILFVGAALTLSSRRRKDCPATKTSHETWPPPPQTTNSCPPN